MPYRRAAYAGRSRAARSTGTAGMMSGGELHLYVQVQVQVGPGPGYLSLIRGWAKPEVDN